MIKKQPRTTQLPICEKVILRMKRKKTVLSCIKKLQLNETNKIKITTEKILTCHH